jgi:hypothetical protein
MKDKIKFQFDLGKIDFHYFYFYFNDENNKFVL